jgi:hypothetical protein
MRYSLLTWVFAVFLASSSVHAQAPLTAGNPIVRSVRDLADPEMNFFAGRYYIYPTTEQGTQFHAYSSADLTNWSDEGVIFDLAVDCSWARNNGWAPSVVFRNNQYYFYYSANSKIGVASGPTPTGPFTDLGQPFIGSDPITMDIIDPMVFVDDDGQAYMYYGGSNGSRLGMRRLDPSMNAFDGSPAQNITPPNYTEAPYLLKRNGLYYMTYSNGNYRNGTYNVQYSTSTSPTGPWTYGGQILSSDQVRTGPGHASITRVPGCDQYYMTYHRYEPGATVRSLCIDRLNFESDGRIQRVNMTTYGVRPLLPGSPCTAGNVLSGGVYKLTLKGSSQCLEVLNNSTSAGARVQQGQDNGSAAQRWRLSLEPDGHYNLTHEGTTQALQPVGGASTGTPLLEQNTAGTADAQRWQLQALTDGYYKITLKGTNLCVEATSTSPGADVRLAPDNGNNLQRWQLEISSISVISGRTYKLVHKSTEQVLEVENNSPMRGANVQQNFDLGTSGQRWVITQEAGGSYKLTHKNALDPTSNRPQCLDVADNSASNNANVQQYDDNGATAQRWVITPTDNEYVKLTHEGTNQCLDVLYNSAEALVDVAQYQDNGNDAQRWRLELISDAPATPTSVRPGAAAAATLAVQAYPNPFTSQLTVQVAALQTGPAQVELVDPLGRVVATREVELRAGAQEVPVACPAGAAGLYLLRVRQGQQQVQAKLMR